MVDLGQLQILAQLIDDMEIATEKLGEAYAEKDAGKFKKSKEALLDFQRKVTRIAGSGITGKEAVGSGKGVETK